MSVSLQDQIACIKREIGFRERVYPRWVDAKKMTQEKADAELRRMQAVLATLEELQAKAVPGLPL